MNYDAFIDIEFNQKIPYSQDKGPFNCQARSCTIYSTLIQSNYSDEQISEMLQSPEKMKYFYGKPAESFEQQTLL